MFFNIFNGAARVPCGRDQELLIPVESKRLLLCIIGSFITTWVIKNMEELLSLEAGVAKVSVDDGVWEDTSIKLSRMYQQDEAIKEYGLLLQDIIRAHGPAELLFPRQTGVQELIEKVRESVENFFVKAFVRNDQGIRDQIHALFSLEDHIYTPDLSSFTFFQRRGPIAEPVSHFIDLSRLREASLDGYLDPPQAEVVRSKVDVVVQYEPHVTRKPLSEQKILLSDKRYVFFILMSGALNLMQMFMNGFEFYILQKVSIDPLLDARNEGDCDVIFDKFIQNLNEEEFVEVDDAAASGNLLVASPIAREAETGAAASKEVNNPKSAKDEVERNKRNRAKKLRESKGPINVSEKQKEIPQALNRRKRQKRKSKNHPDNNFEDLSRSGDKVIGPNMEALIKTLASESDNLVVGPIYRKEQTTPILILCNNKSMENQGYTRKSLEPKLSFVGPKGQQGLKFINCDGKKMLVLKDKERGKSANRNLGIYPEEFQTIKINIDGRAVTVLIATLRELNPEHVKLLRKSH